MASITRNDILNYLSFFNEQVKKLHLVLHLSFLNHYTDLMKEFGNFVKIELQSITDLEGKSHLFLN